MKNLKDHWKSSAYLKLHSNKAVDGTMTSIKEEIESESHKSVASPKGINPDGTDLYKTLIEEESESQTDEKSKILLDILKKEESNWFHTQMFIIISSFIIMLMFVFFTGVFKEVSVKVCSNGYWGMLAAVIIF